MRRFALLLWLAIALTLTPRHLHAWDDEPYKEAERLALQERYEEAVALLQQYDVPNNGYKWVQSKIGLCATYGLWGKNAEALAACNQALDHRLFKQSLKCVETAMREGISVLDAQPCSNPTAERYDLILYMKLWQALAFHRSGAHPWVIYANLDMIRKIMIYDKSEMLFYYAITSYMVGDFKGIIDAYRSEGWDTRGLEHLRVVLTYGGASTPAARAARTARILWAEQPYAKPAVYVFAAILLCTAIYFPARRPLRMLSSAALSTAQAVPRSINAWLHPATRPIAASAPATAYAPSPPPAPMPMYYSMRYPNQAYRIAGYCFAAFWLVLLGPLVVALLLPAFTLLSDFSTRGFQNAYSHFWHILTTSMAWARLWFALLLFSLLGFVAFKLYGRFSLPKRMRPPIRVVYGTLRFMFLGAILTAVGTFLSYFTATFTGLYSNPLVKTLINLIRKIIGI